MSGRGRGVGTRPRTRLPIALAALTAAVQVAAVLSGPPASAAPALSARSVRAQKEPAVSARTAGPVRQPRAVTGRAFTVAAPVWPAAATVDVDAAATGGERAAGTPVSVTRVAASVAASVAARLRVPSRVRVQVFDHQTSLTAGVRGVLLRVARTDGAPTAATGGATATTGGAARVTLDYSGFRGAYGADWASRLRFSVLPPCALTTPAARACQGRGVPTVNDPAAGTVSASVNLAPAAAPAPGGSAPARASAATTAGGTLLAVSAAPSGPAGDYAATSLTSSGTWSAGGNSGDFSWSYPMRVPPSLGGPAPAVGLSYSSASVDGQMAASNNQPSWIGAGFDWTPGGIERRYLPCGADRTPGANNTQNTGDQCWATDNATMAMSGHAGELIQDGSNPNRWHLRHDDGTFVEHRTGAGNGARDGEWWVATTTDGTQYWFGGKPATNSTLTVPVYGNHPGEPCHAATFAASSCTQAYRWNLDHVVDPHGNSMTYFYAKETNSYARNLTPTDLAQYDRSSYLQRIEYGSRDDRSEPAPMQVVFDTADRCLSDCGNHDAAHYPDVPFDQECTASPCGNPSPTFWTTKRLVKVTTRIGSRDVEQWTLTQSFPDPGDGTRAGLWLEKISHTGLAAGATPTPDITFAGVQLNNRVDTIDHSPAMNWWRIKTINTETGGKIDVTYSPPDCVAGSRTPNVNALQDNTLRCYPVKWTPAGYTQPVTDFFHKYVVTDVVEADLTGGAPRVRTHYDYVGAPAWHWTDDDGLVKNEDKTWSVWRGYTAVRTIRGDAGEQTATETRFFRGMHGDHLPSASRSVQLPAIAVGNVPAVDDEDVYAGMVRETVTYNGPGGPEVAATASEPWQSPPTATRTRNGVTVQARYVGEAVKHSRTALDKGRAPRTSSIATGHDDTYGMVVSSEDRGDDAVTGDEKCTLTDYARNTGAWLVATPSRVRGFAVDCAKAQAGGLRDDDVTSEERTYYDNQGLGVAPTKAEVTKTEVMKAYHNGSPEYVTTATSQYDAYGRVTKGTDARGNLTTSVYTPSAGGPVTQLSQTNQLGWTTTVTSDPAWGVPLTTVDANGRKTSLAYDGLGRLVSVWKPGRDRATQSANVVYEYQVRTNAATTVITRKLTPAGGYLTSYALYDGLLRDRQTQQPDRAGGPNAVVTDNYYDTAGRAVRANSAYLSTVAPSPSLVVPTAVIPAQTSTVYDGAGRSVASILKVSAPPGGSPGGTEKWRTTTAYGGDRTDVTPPAGGTVTSTVVDLLGRTTELRQYHAGAAAGSDDPAGYDETGYQYDRKGRLVKLTDPAGNVWTYGYDFLGRQVSAVDPDKGTITSVFNDAGDMVSSSDARNQTLAFSYDQRGRRTGTYAGTVAPANQLARWDYDTLANGTRVNDQLIRATRYVGGAAYVKEITGFTVDYQPTSVKYTIPDSQTGLAGSYSYTYTYNQDGSPSTVRVPALGDLGQETLTYGYDGLGQANTLDSKYGANVKTSLAASTSYTSFGELGAYTLRNNGGNTVDVVRTYETDTRRLAQIWTSKQVGPTTVGDLRYGYDAAGNVTRLADLTSGDQQCFRADYLNRLTEAWTPASGDCGPDPAAAALGGPAEYWQSFRYDTAGNRTTLVEHATASGDRTTSYTVPAGKHLLTGTSTTDSGGTRTAGYTYDAAGNTLTRPAGTAGTQTMTWDPEGHLAASTDNTGRTSYVYSADGDRLIRQDPTGGTLYLPGQELRYSATGGAKTASRYYTHAGQTIAVRAASGLTWLSSDAQGTAQISVAAVSQAVSTRRQTPFGTSRSATAGWPAAMDKGFVGGTNDNTGLTHLGAREYDPGSGRFISRDPIADTSDPQQMNGYAYSGNAPVTKSDPTGRLGSASCAPGEVGGPGACTGHEHDSDTPAPAPWNGPCDSQHSASNCEGGQGSGGGSSTWKGPCDSHHSASNCDYKEPAPNPWDVISTTVYGNGTTLVVFRNGKAKINGFMLPDGIIDPEAMAAKVDASRQRGEEPDNPISTTGRIAMSCNPQICTLEFKNTMETLHQKLLVEGLQGYMGVCTLAGGYAGAGGAVEWCVYGGKNGAVYETSAIYLGAGTPDLSYSVYTSQTMSDDMTKLCGWSNFASGNLGPFNTGTSWNDNNEMLTTTFGVGIGLTKDIGGAQAGRSYTNSVKVSYGDGPQHQLCK